jgi:ATP adenylyltransferase
MMKILWAPWRMEYVTASSEKRECIFCPGDDRSRDLERLILHVGDRSIVLMNRFPYSNGHLLVAPVRHVSAFDALTDDDKLDLITMVEKAVGILTKAMKPDGFNIGVNMGRIAGAGVEEHIHFHVVPRWSGDTNYMTVVGDVRVIPEHIQATYQKLVPLFKGL